MQIKIFYLSLYQENQPIKIKVMKTDAQFPNTITINGEVWYKYSGTTHKVGQMRYHNNKSIFGGERELITIDSNLKLV